MATNLKIDENLLADAVEAGHFKTKKEAVNQALAEFVQRRKQLQMLELEGTIDFFEGYDYKAARRAR